MTQSLAHLLKEARDFSDYQKVEARIVEQFIERSEAMGALLKLAERVEALESGQPEVPPDPRPPTRLGDEFPDGFGPRRPILECNQCGNFPAQADLLREHHQIGDACPAGGLADRDCDGTLRKPGPELPDRFRPAPVEAEPADAIVDQLQLVVGHRYKRRDGVEAVITGRDSKEAGTHYEFIGDTEGLRERWAASGKYHLGTIVGGGSTIEFDLVEDLGPVASEPLRLKVGERYERRDGVLADCVAHHPQWADSGGAFDCEGVDGKRIGYYANGRFIDQEHPLDIVRHIGPTPVAPVVRSAPDWLTDEMVELLRSGDKEGEWVCAISVHWHHGLPRGRSSEWWNAYHAVCRALAARLAPHLDDERKALLAEVGR